MAMFGLVETAADKLMQPAAKGVVGLIRRAWVRTHADHRVILGCRRMGESYPDRYVLEVGIAPSRSAKPIPLSDFVPKAQRVAAEIFLGMPVVVTYSGPELIRFVVRRSHGPAHQHQHFLEIHPSGLVNLEDRKSVV